MTKDPTKIPQPTVEFKVTVTFSRPLPEDYEEFIEATLRNIVDNALMPCIESDLAPVLTHETDFDVWEHEEE